MVKPPRKNQGKVTWPREFWCKHAPARATCAERHFEHPWGRKYVCISSTAVCAVCRRFDRSGADALDAPLVEGAESQPARPDCSDAGYGGHDDAAVYAG